MIRQRSFMAFIILNLLTCGLYSLFFWYNWNEDVNRICEGDGQEMPNYIVVWLLGMLTCGIYVYYWMYKQGNRLQSNAGRYGIWIQENGSGFLVWALLGLVTCELSIWYSYYLMISAVNKIAPAYNRYYYRTQPSGRGKEPDYGYRQSEPEHTYEQSDTYEQPEPEPESAGRQEEPEHMYEQSEPDSWKTGTGRVQGRIICISGPEAGHETEVADAQTLILGQDGSICNHIIMGNGIEAKHCSVTYRKFDNMYLVKDYSVSGTFRAANDSRLPADRHVELPAGTVIYLGDRATMYRLG